MGGDETKHAGQRVGVHGCPGREIIRADRVTVDLSPADPVLEVATSGGSVLGPDAPWRT